MSNLQESWDEAKVLEAELKDIYLNVKQIGHKLQEAYKAISKELNSGQDSEEFIQETDFTRNTLYYCMDPMSEYSSVFFVKDSKGSRVPVLFALVPQIASQEPGIEITVSPGFTEAAFARKGLKYQDVLVKFSDLKEPLKNQWTDWLMNSFETPPAPEPEHKLDFDNILKQRLYEMTENPEFKKSRIISIH